MIALIIAGGSGTRLWPLSQANYPKHLLKLTGSNSLLQNTFERTRHVADTIYILTEASHSDEVRAQLPALGPDRFIIEPARRGTASCILLALATIRAKHSADESVVFLHADHHITNDLAFKKTVDAACVAARSQNTISLIGIQPTYPATGFGYIELGEAVEGNTPSAACKVASFKEKPDLSTAERYLATGTYLWNLGLFTGTIEAFEVAMKQYALDLWNAYQKLQNDLDDAQQLTQTYLNLPSQPIDTALIERCKDLVVVPGEFDWADIGSFFDLHKILQGKDANALKGNVELVDCEDSMIHGYNKPIVAIGLSGIVVVDSPEGILVCAKDKSQLVGEVVKKLQSRSK